MKILDYSRFVERFNIDKIDIKKIETEKIILPGDVFPEPGKTVKESLKNNMIAIIHIINNIDMAYIEKRYLIITIDKSNKEKLAVNHNSFFELRKYDDNKLFKAETNASYASYVSSLWELYGPLRNELFSIKERHVPYNYEIKELLDKTIKAKQKPIWTIDENFEKNLFKQYNVSNS